MKTKPTVAYHGAANENLFGASPKVQDALQETLQQLHSYPTPDAAPLRGEIAAHLQVQPEHVVVGSGSAELISLLIRTYAKPHAQCNIVSLAPTYPLYRMEAEALGVAYREAPLNSLQQIDAGAILRQIDADTKLVFISNPNNPTGSYLSSTQLQELLQQVPAHTLLVLDEAYIEFVHADNFGSGLPYLPQHPNLVVLRTFSKAYGIAALRVGYMVAQEAVVAQVQQVKQPYNVNQMAQAAALAALQDEEHLQQTLAETVISKAQLQQLLQEEGVQYWPSEGNFLYLDAGVLAKYLVPKLEEQGIQVRQTGNRHNIRLTVGRHEQQLYLQEQLQRALAPSAIWQNETLAHILETGYTLARTQDVFESLAAVSALAERANNIGSAPERIALAYARAFSKCLGPEGNEHSGNLYSSTYGETDMISAFNVLVKSTPLVTFGHMFSNFAIEEATAHADAIHILDLGIGSGLQWLHLLDMLANRTGTKPHVRITGVDIPAATGAPDSRLRQTGDILRRHAERLGLTFSYTPIAGRLEQLDLQQDIFYATDEALIVNLAFTLHHLPDQLLGETDYRDLVLQQIKALNPTIFTLTEPDSEHNRLELLPRLRESLRHYYTVFDALDTLLPRLLPERQVIEQEFFGREIINVISCEGLQRVERHERHEHWQLRLARNGFAPAPVSVSPESINSALRLHKHFALEPNNAGFWLSWKGTTVVSATAWA